MKLVHEDGTEKLLESDSPWFGSHALVFRRAALKQLGTLLQDYGELLPVANAEAELLLFNPTRVIAGLDEAASSVLRFKNGRIMRVNRYVLREDAITGVDIFKLSDLRVSPTFLSERVVQLWRSAGLRGLEFNLVWSPG